MVLVDSGRKLYLAPPCVRVENWASFSEMTIGTARGLKFSPEPKCRDDGGFTAEGRSLTGMALEKLGVLGPRASRWNTDGSWNW